MSNGKGIVGGITGILISAILIYAGNSILETIPESDEPEGSLKEQTENLPREIGWAFIFGGIIGIILSLLGIYISAKGEEPPII